MLRVISKLDAKPIIEKLKSLDFKSLDEGKKMSKEDQAILAFEMMSELLPQLGKIEHDLIPLIAAIRDIPEKEASELDAGAVLSELFNDGELIGFFKSALMKKAGV